jgi:hypothetical protein
LRGGRSGADPVARKANNSKKVKVMRSVNRQWCLGSLADAPAGYSLGVEQFVYAEARAVSTRTDSAGIERTR